MSLEPADPDLVYQPKKAETGVSLAVDPRDYPAVVTDYEPTKAQTENRDAFLLRVNRTCSTVTVYVQDKDGKYTVPVKAMRCSVGAGTPLGVYRTSDKYAWHELLGRVYGQYCTRITGRILFHSVPYTRMSRSSLKTAEYNKLGDAVSMGCVRLACGDAHWIYVNCASGTQVEFYDDPDPGPLGKPDLIPLDPNDPNCGWDPTDPNEKNPWAGSLVYAPKPDDNLPEIIGII